MRALLLGLWLAAGLARADLMDHFAMREDVGPHKAPYLGRAELLVMPVEVKGHPPFDRAALERFFAAGTPNGFVQFYETASLGRYAPHVTVGPTITYDTCPLPLDKFPGCAVARGDINSFSAGMGLIRDVVRRSQAAGVDFAGLDVNGRKGVADGWADGVMLLTNVPFGGIAFPIGFFNRDDNLDGGVGGPLLVDGVKVTHVAIAGDSNPFVLVHEFGHLLGLTDLYDESGTYAGLQLSYMGAWGYDERIVLPDAETRLRLRWAAWHQVQGRQAVVIHPAETSGDVYRLGTGDEYFLLENRGPGVFDRSLSDRGLAIFHVDRTVKLSPDEGTFVNRLLDCVDCDPWHPYIRLLQADGLFHLENNGKFNATTDLFGDGSALAGDPSGQGVSRAHQLNSTNRYSGSATGLSVSGVRVLANGDIEATLEAPATDQCGDQLCASGEGCQPVDCGAPATPAPTGHGCGVVPLELPGLAVAVLLALLEQRLHRRHGR